MQYSALKQIDKRNVNRLELAWSYPVPGSSTRFGSHPLIVEGMMYVRGSGNSFAASLFEAYFQEDTPVLRKLIAWMLELVHPAAVRSILLENAPLNVEITCNSRGRDTFVHLLNYGGDKRMGGAPRVDAFASVHGIRVGVECASRARQVLLVPENKPIAFEWRNRRAWFSEQPLTVASVYWIRA
jgi:hypothetical protein